MALPRLGIAAAQQQAGLFAGYGWVWNRFAADYDEWDQEKLRIVLAHERSRVRQGDFYIQALAGFYVALFWFSPWAGGSGASSLT